MGTMSPTSSHNGPSRTFLASQGLVALCALSPTAASADEDHQAIRVKVVNVSGGLTEGAVRDGLDPVIEHMEACYLDRRKEIPRLRGTLLIDVKVDAEGAVVALKSREDSAEDEGLLQCFDGLSETLLAKPDRALASSIRLEVRLAPPPVERIQLKAQDGENVGALIGAVREPDSVWAYDPPDLKLYGRLESSDVEKAVGKLKKRIAKAYRGEPDRGAGRSRGEGDAPHPVRRPPGGRSNGPGEGRRQRRRRRGP